jgi:hypothetical protein
MQIRFTLDSAINMDLIAKILARAGGKSPSQAARAMMIEWSYFEDMTLKRQENVTQVSNPRQDSESEIINLSGLDSLDLDF